MVKTLMKYDEWSLLFEKEFEKYIIVDFGKKELSLQDRVNEEITREEAYDFWIQSTMMDKGL